MFCLRHSLAGLGNGETTSGSKKLPARGPNWGQMPITGRRRKATTSVDRTLTPIRPPSCQLLARRDDHCILRVAVQIVSLSTRQITKILEVADLTTQHHADT